MITMRCNVCGETPCTEQRKTYKKCKPASSWGWSSGGSTSSTKEVVSYTWQEMAGPLKQVQNDTNVAEDIRKLIGNNQRLRTTLSDFVKGLEDSSQPMALLQWQAVLQNWLNATEGEELRRERKIFANGFMLSGIKYAAGARVKKENPYWLRLDA